MNAARETRPSRVACHCRVVLALVGAGSSPLVRNGLMSMPPRRVNRDRRRAKTTDGMRDRWRPRDTDAVLAKANKCHKADVMPVQLDQTSTSRRASKMSGKVTA
jgi:hypothetical protein